ncbi:MAG: hypothetical protein KDI83_20790, partial [Gammaproteobacteria bacterium]|nr:hypothetical protein [Gammaproteobacteria bacterium]
MQLIFPCRSPWVFSQFAVDSNTNDNCFVRTAELTLSLFETPPLIVRLPFEESGAVFRILIKERYDGKGDGNCDALSTDGP